MPFPWRRHQPSAGPTVIPRQLAERQHLTPVEPSPVPRVALRAATISRDDHWLVGAALRAFQEANSLTEAQLAHVLGIAVERLRWLQMRTRPNPESPTFESDVQRLADTFGCDPDMLFDVLAA